MGRDDGKHAEAAGDVPPLRVEREDDEEGRPLLRVHGDLTLAGAGQLWDALRHQLRRGEARRARCDLSGVASAQPGALALLLERLYARDAGDDRVFGANEEVQRLLHLLRRMPHKEPEQAPRSHLAGRVGDAIWSLVERTKYVAAFLGDGLVGTARAFRHPSSVRWKDVPALCVRAGFEGLMVVGTVSFLAGLMLGFQMADRLVKFGANDLIARLEGVAVTRHLGPFMTALMVAGRSGSAIAAELSTMKITHEVDGLRVMGIDPMRFLVFPRMLALCIAVPLLAAYANLTGLFGGLVVGSWRLGVSTSEYLHTLRASLDMGDVIRGLAKALVFAVAIGFLACERGLRTTGGSLEVGKAATEAVVAILFVLVALEATFAAFNLFFHV
jgi:phospholipid/cholesterol/gamma-HCH transport system permease protein